MRRERFPKAARRCGWSCSFIAANEQKCITEFIEAFEGVHRSLRVQFEESIPQQYNTWKDTGGGQGGGYTTSVTASISKSIQGPYRAVYLKLTGWWGLALQISASANFPLDPRTASYNQEAEPIDFT